MLMSCSYCGGLHSRGEDCPRKPVRANVDSDINKFRWSRRWRTKSLAIRDRDSYLCQVCKQDKVYVYDGLEVHHIEPIIHMWQLRLDDNNLITLCTSCHKKADNDKIDKKYLKSIVSD